MKSTGIATEHPAATTPVSGAAKMGTSTVGKPSKSGKPSGGDLLGDPEGDAPPLRFGVIWRLGKLYYGRYAALTAGYIVASLLGQSVLQPVIAAMFAHLTNETRAGDATQPAHASLGLVTTYLVWMAFTVLFIGLGFCLRRLATALDVTVGNAIRRDVFARILHQGPQFFHEHDEGELTMIVNQLCNDAQSGLRQLLVDPCLQIASIASIGVTLYATIANASQQTNGGGTGPLFGLIAVAALLSPWLVARMGSRLQRNQLAMQRQGLVLASLVGGAVKAPEEVQALRAEDIFDRKHVALLGELRSVRLQGATTLQTLNLLNRLPGDVVLFVLLGIAVYFSVHHDGALSPGTLVAVALLTPLFMGAVQNLGGYSIAASLSWPSIALIDTMLGTVPASRPDATPAATLLPSPAATPPATATTAEDKQLHLPVLEVEDLTFSYEPNQLPNILDQVSFAPPPGRVTGLVARAGQGKTTFFRLGMRFYDPQLGTIRLDGVRNVDLPLSELRRRIVLMAQFPAFFADTVRENFLLAKPDATDAEIRRWAELTDIWRVLERCFPHGDPLDAPFLAGAPLSGGQKKLFALTRCLLREPDLLFLDEPTTGMDPHTKFHFIPPMRASCEGRTVLVVDHDILWQLRFCDYFLVLDEGRIVEQGTGRELLARHGLFRAIFDEQTEGLRDLLRLLEELDISAAALAAKPPAALPANAGSSSSTYAIEKR